MRTHFKDLVWIATGLRQGDTNRRQYAISELPDFLSRVQDELPTISSVNVWEYRDGRKTLVMKFNWPWPTRGVQPPWTKGVAQGQIRKELETVAHALPREEASQCTSKPE